MFVQPRSRFLVLIVAAVAASVSIGCGDSVAPLVDTGVVGDAGSDASAEFDAGSSPDAGPPAPLCTRDLDVLDERRECQRDDDCACGAFCEFNLCDYECTVDADCESDRACDTNGRCSLGFAPKHQVSNLSGIVADSASIDLRDAMEPSTLMVSREGREIDDLRVVAGAGVQVSCGAEFAQECVLSLVGPTPQTLQVRGTGSAARDYSIIRIIPRLGTPLRVPVRFAPSLYPGVVWGDIEGVATYQGRATLPSLGYELAGEAAVNLPDVPVSFEIHPGVAGLDRIVVIRDPTQAFTDDGALVGRMQAPSEGFEGAMQFPAYLFAGPANPAPTEMQLVAQPTTDVSWVAAESARFDLLLSLTGVASQDPLLRFRMDVTRVADAPVGAPPVLPSPFVGTQGPSNADAIDIVEGNFDVSTLTGSVAERAAQAACMTEAAPLATLDASGGTVSERLTDLACSGSDRAFAHNYALAADEAVGSLDNSLREVIEACRDEMQTFNAGEPISGTIECIDLPRALAVMGLLADDERVGAWEGESLFRRAAQRWLELTSFLSTQAVRFDAMTNAVEGADDSAAQDHYGEWRSLIQPMLRRFLTPRLGGALVALDGPALTSRTYRGPASGSVATEAGDVSIAIALLRALGDEASLHDVSLVEQQRISHAGGSAFAVPESSRQELRQTLALAAIAGGWSAEAIATDSAWATDPRLRGAWTRFEREYRSILGRMVAIDAGRNEFGLVDGEVPIYLRTSATDSAERAFAVSEYLTGSHENGWLTTEIERARTALSTARSVWSQTREASFQNELAGVELERRIADRVSEFDGRLQALCPHSLPARAAFPSPEAWVAEVATAWRSLDPRDCWVRRASPECNAIPAPPTALGAPVARADVEVELCVAAQLMFVQPCVADGGAGAACTNPAYRRPGVGYLPSDGALSAPQAQLLTSILRSAVSADDEPAVRTWTLTLEEDADPELLRVTSGGGTLLLARSQLLSASWGAAPADDAAGDPLVINALSECRELLGAGGLGGGALSQALDNPACYQGSIGEAMLTTRAAISSAEAAGQRFDEHLDAYDNAVQRCVLVDGRNDALDAEATRHQEATEDLRTASAILGTVGSVLGMGADYAASRSNRQLVESRATNASRGAAQTSRNVGGALRGLSIATDIAGFFVGNALEEAEATHDANVAGIERDYDRRECMREAERELVGMGSAASDARAASQQASIRMLSAANMRTELAGLVAGGESALTDELALDLDPLRGSPWLDESLAAYQRTFRFARRLTYLSVIAAEYEQQLTLGGLRSDVIAADTPDDLEAVRANLAANVATRRIHGSSPQTTVSVVSVRDEIFAVENREEAEPGEHRATAVERFRSLLVDPRFAVFEDDEYQGQLLPFELLSPDEAVEGLGANGFSASACAERLWSVAVAVVGDPELNSAGTQTEMHLLKRDRFHSQWCSAGGDGTHQVATFDSSRNLFLDPQVSGSIEGLAQDPVDPYTRLVLNNVATNATLADVERTDYNQGVQTGLAGLGLFGEYALLVPAASLRYESCDAMGECTDDGERGVDLSLADDIYIRFEYTAGAR
ncbi:MAG: hypothetical protein AB8H86_04380 [Polyangiales bacterium]